MRNAGKNIGEKRSFVYCCKNTLSLKTCLWMDKSQACCKVERRISK